MASLNQVPVSQLKTQTASPSRNLPLGVGLAASSLSAALPLDDPLFGGFSSEVAVAVEVPVAVALAPGP